MPQLRSISLVETFPLAQAMTIRVVTRKQLGSSHQDKYQPKRERETADEAGGGEAQPRVAGNNGSKAPQGPRCRQRRPPA